MLREKAMMMIASPIRKGGQRKLLHEDKKPKPKTPPESLRIRTK